MAIFAPTDWQVSDVQVIRQARPWGPNAGKQVAAKLTFHTNGVSLSALTYPTGGLPCPPPNYFGFDHALEYLIPLGPMAVAAHPAQSTIIHTQFVPAPTGTPTEPPRLRLFRYTVATAFAGQVTNYEYTSGGVTLITPTTNTAGLVGYVIAVGN